MLAAVQSVGDNDVPCRFVSVETCFRVNGLGFRASGFGFIHEAPSFRINCLGLRVQGSGLRVQGVCGTTGVAIGVARGVPSPFRLCQGRGTVATASRSPEEKWEKQVALQYRGHCNKLQFNIKVTMPLCLEALNKVLL